MSESANVDDLLVVWEEAREHGKLLSPEELCIEHPDLLDEVSRRVRILDRMYSALDDPTDIDTDTVSVRHSDHWPHPEGFELVDFLGRGGAGIVYKAWQPALARFVAIKVIRDEACNAERLSRFRAEAKAAQLQHPNIVRTYDIGECSGQPFLALEFLNAGTLADWTKGEPQEPRDVATLVEKLADALQYAHERGIVHRDLKPGNILFQSTTGPIDSDSPQRELWPSLVPKIVDFGIARFLDDSAGFTMTGDVMGTPAYMAPEQADGRTSDIGPPTDIHALGIVLFELLTGRSPFASPSRMRTLNLVRHKEAMAASEIQPGVPRDIETICLKCLQKEPSTRYATAGELAADLRNFVAGRPVSARPLSRAGRLIRWTRRKPVVAGLLAILAAVVAVGFSVVTWKWLEADEAKALADRNFAQIRHVVDDYLVIVGDDVLLKEPGMQPLRERLLRSALDYYEGYLASNATDPSLQSEQIQVRVKLARIQRMLGQHTEAEAHLRNALDAVRTSNSATGVSNEIENDLAAVLTDQGKLDDALEVLASALKGKPTGQAHQIANARSHMLRGQVQRRLGQTEDAIAAVTIAVDGFQQLSTSGSEPGVPRELGEALVVLASQQMSLGNHSGALTSFRHATEVAEQLAASDPSNLAVRTLQARVYAGYGRLVSRQRDWAEALKHFEKSENIQSELIRRNPHVVSLRLSLCEKLIDFGSTLAFTQPGAAGDFDDRAISEARNLRVSYPGMVAGRDLLVRALTNSATRSVSLRDATTAENNYREAKAICEELVRQQPNVIEYRANLARSLEAMSLLAEDRGAMDEAVKMARAAVRHARGAVALAPSVPANQRRLAGALKTFASVTANTSLAEAIVMHQEAVQLLSVVTQGQSKATLSARISLAQHQLTQGARMQELGRTDEASKCFDAATRLLTKASREKVADPEIRFALGKAHLASGSLRLSLKFYGATKQQLADAQADNGQAVDMFRALTGDYPEVPKYREWQAAASNNFGNSLRLGKKHGEALDAFSEAIEVQRELCAESASRGIRHQLARSLMNLGTLKKETGQADAAVKLYDEATKIWKDILDTSANVDAQSSLVAAYGNLGGVHWAKRDARKALPAYVHAIETADELLAREPNHVRTTKFKEICHFGRARSLNKLGRYAEAASDWRVVLKTAAPSSKTLFRMELGWSLAKAGNHREPAEIAETLIEANPDALPVLFNCARLFALSYAAIKADEGIATEVKRERQDHYLARTLDVLRIVQKSNFLSGITGRAKLVSPDFRAVVSEPDFRKFASALDD